jgi:hypothetical protein
MHPAVRKYLSEIGKKGGRKGGLSRSPRKAESSRKNAGKDPLIARIQAERGCTRQWASILAQRERASQSVKPQHKPSRTKKQRVKRTSEPSTAVKGVPVAQMDRATAS